MTRPNSRASQARQSHGHDHPKLRKRSSNVLEQPIPSPRPPSQALKPAAIRAPRPVSDSVSVDKAIATASSVRHASSKAMISKRGGSRQDRALRKLHSSLATAIKTARPPGNDRTKPSCPCPRNSTKHPSLTMAHQLT